MIARFIAAALLLLASPAIADDLNTSSQLGQIRLPIVKTVVVNGKVVLQITGSTPAVTNSTAGLYIGPNGYTPNPAEAQDVRGPAGQDGQAQPGTPGPTGPASTVPGPAGPAGRAPTAQEIATAVNAYIAANPPAKGDKGDTGAASTIPGPAGANATDAQVVAAVTAYLAAHPPAKGDPGAPGATGSPGSAGAIGATGPAGPSGATFLGNVTLTQTATIAIALGPRQISVPLTGCVAGERVLLTPVSAPPVGYMVGDAGCYTAGTLTATVYAPLLAIGSSYSLVVKTTVFR